MTNTNYRIGIARLIILLAIFRVLIAGCTGNTAAITKAESGVPQFSHVYLVILENREFSSVIGSAAMPRLNALVKDGTLLTRYYAVAHPSLPNYIALIGGDTFGIKSDCTDCFVNQPSLADVLEQNKLTWKTYQEGLPEPCFVGSTKEYRQKHNPFIYFDPVRANAERCKANVVSLDQLATDLAAKATPSFSLITPNMCHSGHDCPESEADAWLGGMVDSIRSSAAYDDHSLIVVTWDEGSSDDGCCGMGYHKGGGRVAALLISPLARAGFEDDTDYTHYSLLRTLLAGWGLPPFGQAAQARNPLIVKPWSSQPGG